MSHTTTASGRPLRVLYAFDRAPYPLHYSGGAERSCHETMAALAARGLNTMVIGSHRVFNRAELSPEDERRLGVRAIETSADEVVYDCGYPVVILRGDFEAGLRRRMAEFAPDIVCTHLNGAIEVIRMANRAGAVPVWFVRDAECGNHPDPHLDEAHALGTRMMVSSPFLWNHLLTNHGIDSTVVYPLVDPVACTAPHRGEYLTLINPVQEKGVSIFVRIVERMPELPFLACEGWKMDSSGDIEQTRETFQRFPNVRLIPATSDVREIFAQTRLLLMPSMWREGFGRVALEAQFSGIPVVASRRGGLADFREGIVLVEDFMNPDAWVRTIRAIMNDQAIYDRLSERALLHAQRPDLSRDHLIDAFLGTVTPSLSSPMSC
jgi:glycosyltransferase involved in cell wall biosynthesis